MACGSMHAMMLATLLMAALSCLARASDGPCDGGACAEQSELEVGSLLQTGAPPRGAARAEDSSGFCCRWLASGQTCGECLQRNADRGWCGLRESRCTGPCGGTWCPGASATAPPPPSWVTGTWTTGYWDCCKPSCSWPGKGSQTQPVRACLPSGDGASPLERSVCDGGNAGTCADQQWKIVNSTMAMGFAAAAVSGSHGLLGDENCGQCFELLFTDQRHDPREDNWGGSHPSLVGKTLVIQVTNIGHDVSGNHSFDIMIPGAGQGQFTSGCPKQFPAHSSGDFDCDNNWGGCSDIAGCERLPGALQEGCRARYTWYYWLAAAGQTNNPFVNFRRVKCPAYLTSKTGSSAADDNDQWPVDCPECEII